MTRNEALFVSPRTPSAGFTLTEIVISVAVVATAFVAIVGLLPSGLDASRRATNSTVTAAILEDLNSRVKGEALPQENGAPVVGNASFSPAYFDDHGVYLNPNDTSNNSRRLYRADVQIGVWNSGSQPAGTSSWLRPISIKLSWPVDAKSGAAIGTNNPQFVVTYIATSLTGSNWPAIDAQGSYVFTPKIEY
jgi:uncharacterized protein (TIGR02598 family)